jgi:hypothetical protein
MASLEFKSVETLALSANADFMAMIQRSRARHAKEGGVDLDEARRQLGVGRGLKTSSKQGRQQNNNVK